MHSFIVAESQSMNLKKRIYFIDLQDNKRCSNYPIMKMTEATTLDLTRKEVDLKPLPL